MYFSVSPQAYLDSLEGNTNTNTILETVPSGSLIFTLSTNKENLAFWRNLLVLSTNKCLWLRNWEISDNPDFLGVVQGLLWHSCIISHEQGWAELLGGICSQFQRTGFSAPDQLSLGDLCLGIWGAQNIYPTCEPMSSAFCLPAEVFGPFIFEIPVCWIPKTITSVRCCSCWRHNCWCHW